MKFYWICLEDTYRDRKKNIPEEFDISFSKNGNFDYYTVVECKNLNFKSIQIAEENRGCIFIENFSINQENIDTLRSIACLNIPIFWNFNDLLCYARNMEQLFNINNNGSKTIFDTISNVETSAHLLNVANLSYNIALRLTEDEKMALYVRIAGLLHDIGKLVMPHSFLNLNKRYDFLEKSFIELHTFYGYHLIDIINYPYNTDELQYIIGKTVLLHHERIDGSGYPFRKTYDEIPNFVQIVSVADVFSALIENRSYRSSCNYELVINYLKNYKNIHFNEKIVDILEDIINENKDNKIGSNCLPFCLKL